MTFHADLVMCPTVGILLIGLTLYVASLNVVIFIEVVIVMGKLLFNIFCNVSGKQGFINKRTNVFNKISHFLQRAPRCYNSKKNFNCKQIDKYHAQKLICFENGNEMNKMCT